MSLICCLDDFKSLLLYAFEWVDVSTRSYQATHTPVLQHFVAMSLPHSLWILNLFYVAILRPHGPRGVTRTELNVATTYVLDRWKARQQVEIQTLLTTAMAISNFSLLSEFWYIERCLSWLSTSLGSGEPHPASQHRHQENKDIMMHRNMSQI